MGWSYHVINGVHSSLVSSQQLVCTGNVHPVFQENLAVKSTFNYNMILHVIHYYIFIEYDA